MFKFEKEKFDTLVKNLLEMRKRRVYVAAKSIDMKALYEAAVVRARLKPSTAASSEMRVADSNYMAVRKEAAALVKVTIEQEPLMVVLYAFILLEEADPEAIARNASTNDIEASAQFVVENALSEDLKFKYTAAQFYETFPQRAEVIGDIVSEFYCRFFTQVLAPQ